MTARKGSEPRSYIRPHLAEGWVELLDSAHERVCEWYDRRWAQAILNGEANIQEWGRLIKELALTRGYMIQTEFGYVALNDKKWNNDIPERWKILRSKRGYSLLELLVILAILLTIGGIGAFKLIHAFQEVFRWLTLVGQTVVR